MSCRPVCVLLILSLTGLTYSTGIEARTEREAIHSRDCCLCCSVFLHDRIVLKGQACVTVIFPLSCILSWHFLFFVFLGLATVRKHMSSRGAFPVCTRLWLESKHCSLVAFQWGGCFSSLRSHPFFIYELTSSEKKRASVWMSHFVPMCKSIVLLDFFHMHTPSHRKGTSQSNRSSPHKSLTTFGSEETRWQKPSWSRSEEVLESNLQLHTVNLIRAWRAQAGLLSISRIQNQRPGWPALRTREEINYEFSIQAEGLIYHYCYSTVGIKPELLGFQS